MLQNTQRSKKSINIRLVIILFILIVAAIVIIDLAYRFYLQGTSVSYKNIAYGKIAEVIDGTGIITSRSIATVRAKHMLDINEILYTKNSDVEKDSLLMITTIDTLNVNSDVENIRSQISGIQVRVAQSEQNEERLRSLYEGGIISQTEVEQASALTKELQSQVDSLNHQIRSIRAKLPTESIRAPITGVLTKLYVSDGEIAMPGEPLAEIIDINDLYMIADIPIEKTRQIHEGNKVLLCDMPVYSARVESVAHKASSENSIKSKNKLEIEIIIDNPYPLTVGEEIDIKISGEVKDNVLLIPKEAIIDNNGNDCTYVIKDNLAELREVTIGLSDDNNCEVLEGLSKGDMVILSPIEQIKEGLRINTAGSEEIK